MLQMAKSESGFDPAWDWYSRIFSKARLLHSVWRPSTAWRSSIQHDKPAVFWFSILQLRLTSPQRYRR